MAIESNLPSTSLIDLVLNASIPVQLVMLLLFITSLVSWYFIDQKRSSYKKLKVIADDFEDQFWSGGDMRKIYRDWNVELDSGGIANIFLAGFREFNRLAKKQNTSRADTVNGVHRAMKVALSKEITELESNLSFLATVGSTSPYIGLFGTVWGIMNSFRELGALQQVTIATVAPGIAEALIATAMGLFAAIPAVIAYNKYASTAERLADRYEIFVDEFLSIINRQDIGRD